LRRIASSSAIMPSRRMMVTFRVALKRARSACIVEIEFQPFQQLVVFTFVTSSDSAPLLCRLTHTTYRRPRGLASPCAFRRLPKALSMPPHRWAVCRPFTFVRSDVSRDGIFYRRSPRTVVPRIAERDRGRPFRAAKGRQLARIERCSARACRIHCALRCRQDLVHCKSDEYFQPNDECGE
jgi:hypothetical protein